MHTFWQYILYLMRAGNAHGLHSPFAYQLYTEVIAPDKWYYDFDALENLRIELLNNTTTIEVTDFGAGSKKTNNSQRNIADIAQYSVSPANVSQLLFKLVDFLRPSNIVELGTCLGLNTLYLALPSIKNTPIYTFEGCPNLSSAAEKNFALFGNAYPQISSVQGNIDQTLSLFLQNLAQKNIKSLDFVFFDANHQYEPTMRYFEQCLPFVNENSLFVFDDIYWSAAMTKAWKEIAKHPQVQLSIDLFQGGLVFFRKKQPKQHFTLRFA
jgi:predicted O-methyltransferase YrrM